MKHERNIEPGPKWRLKKTLARKVDFRRTEDGDLRYVWAAYKKGALEPMAGPFASADMDAETFKQTFGETLLKRYDFEWTLLAECARGVVPVGMVMAFQGHKDPSIAPFLVVGDIIWFPWASRRNKVESAVYFFTHARKIFPFIDYAHGEVNKRFFEMLSRHGVMRRIGTTFSVVKGEPVAVFETRAE